MHEQHPVVAQLHGELPDGLQKRQGFDIADRAADLHQTDIRAFTALKDTTLDLVGDVRDDLHRATQVIAAAFLVDDVVVDLAGGEVRQP